MPFLQRDIVLVPFPFTDLSATKQRPVLIVSNNSINKNSKTNDFIALALTSKIRHGSYSVQIRDGDWKNGFLPGPSEIQCDKIATLERSIVRKKLCKLNDTVFSIVKSKLTKVFQLS